MATLTSVLARMGPPPILQVLEEVPPLERTPTPPPRGIGPPPALPAQEDGLRVCDLQFEVENGKKLLRDISMSAARNTLTAIVGPSGAGKSTLVRVLSGLAKPSEGAVTFDGVNMHRHYGRMKSMVGMVPQDDVIHGQLTLVRALRYAARLRLGSEITAKQREMQVQRVISQLDLETHLSTRISKLSGGQRKRASVALELLTEPKFLILDEPTSGLDPALDRQLMEQFRLLADGGRTVLAITHSVACLDMCDQVMVLAPGGEVAFIGSEQKAWRYFGTQDWSEIFERLKNAPQECAARWRHTVDARLLAAEPRAERPPSAAECPKRVSRPRQLATLVRRQLSLMMADRGYTVFLLALPFVVGLLPLVVPGDTGLTQVKQAKYSQEPQMILTLLTIGAIFMGVSMSIRELVGERSIFQRERAMGLSTSAYLWAKMLVFGVLGIGGGILIVTVAELTKSAPTGEGVLGLGAHVELMIALTVTIGIGVILGLLLSSLVTSQNQVMPVLIVVLMLQMVLNGGLIPLVDNDALNALSTAMPARWSFSLSAISTNLHHLLEISDPSERVAVAGSGVALDPAWNPSMLRWGFSAMILAVMASLMAVVTWVRTRRGR